jgi:hypothetical protein
MVIDEDGQPAPNDAPIWAAASALVTHQWEWRAQGRATLAHESEAFEGDTSAAKSVKREADEPGLSRT